MLYTAWGSSSRTLARHLTQTNVSYIVRIVADLAAATADRTGQLYPPGPRRRRVSRGRPSLVGRGGPHHGRRHRPRLADQGARLHSGHRSRSPADRGRRRQEAAQRRFPNGLQVHGASSPPGIYHNFGSAKELSCDSNITKS